MTSVTVSADRLTVNEAISSTMAQYLFVNHLTRADLGSILDLPGQSVSGRMRGRTKWSAEEIAILAAYFGVTPNDLMPSPDGRGGWIPASYVPAYREGPVPSGTGPSAGSGGGDRTRDLTIMSRAL